MDTIFQYSSLFRHQLGKILPTWEIHISSFLCVLLQRKAMNKCICDTLCILWLVFAGWITMGVLGPGRCWLWVASLQNWDFLVRVCIELRVVHCSRASSSWAVFQHFTPSPNVLLQYTEKVCTWSDHWPNRLVRQMSSLRWITESIQWKNFR